MTPGHWLAVIIAIFIALSVANYFVFHNPVTIIKAEATRQLTKGEFAKEYRKFLEEVEKASGPSGRPVHVIVSPAAAPTNRLNQEYGWFIGREIVLTVVAIGGALALYFSDRRKLPIA